MIYSCCASFMRNTTLALFSGDIRANTFTVGGRGGLREKKLLSIAIGSYCDIYSAILSLIGLDFTKLFDNWRSYPLKISVLAP
jgi:hypothetical protein